MLRLASTAFLATFSACALAVSIAEIQGASFRSPLAGKVVQDVRGVVTAKDRYGMWFQSESSGDSRYSNGLRIYGNAILRQVNVGDLISIGGTVAEYRAKDNPNDLLQTQIASPHDVRVLSSDNIVTPLILGKDRIPPVGKLSAADVGPDGWLSVPNNVSLLENLNATLQPDLYGLDFWESLEGQLVTIPYPVAANFPDRFGSFWAYGDWPVSGKNSRGGLTITFSDEDNVPQAHPEAIFVGRAMDGTKNPHTSVGMTLSNITGIVAYQYGYFYVLPLTAPRVISVPNSEVLPSSLVASAHPCELNIGDYNVENMSPRSHHISVVAEHIADYLKTPDVVFVQEIQDDSGPRDNGIVSANKTLATLVKAIQASSGVQYEFVNIAPENNMDGGQPGGNIRVAYLWRPEKVSLIPGLIGNATQATRVVFDDEEKLGLSLNPGRIDPKNSAWEEARKPLAAAWQTISGERFYTVNIHFSSKRDSSSPQGDARPPVNGGSDRRISQANVTATFIKTLLAHDANASIVVAGDLNEFVQTRAVFAPFTGLLADTNEAAGVVSEERYTYVYDQHMQEIDHIFVSTRVAERGVQVEHVHVNTWAASSGARASDHDPTVAKVWVCDSEGAHSGK
ncbi:endonuclease/exonuclease/phosphatase [Amylocystis lapponica]|nr:endonuclease/exonuclease/phosphatase [Amylocystis lapponica]